MLVVLRDHDDSILENRLILELRCGRPISATQNRSGHSKPAQLIVQHTFMPRQHIRAIRDRPLQLQAYNMDNELIASYCFSNSSRVMSSGQ